MPPGIVRWGGWAGVVAAVLFVLASILILIAPPQRGSLNSFSDYLSEVILVVAFALTLVAIAGRHALQSGRYGRSGAAGSLITFIGYALIVVVAAVSTLVGGEGLFAVRLIGVGSTHRLGAPRSYDSTRTGTAVVVRGAAHRRLPPRRCLGRDRRRGERGDRVRDSLGVSGLRAVVEQ